MRQLEQLRASYEEKCRDYENEKQSRRAWQTEVDTARAALKSAEGNPFILALIDGDGVVVGYSCSFISEVYSLAIVINITLYLHSSKRRF